MWNRGTALALLLLAGCREQAEETSFPAPHRPVGVEVGPPASRRGEREHGS